MFIFFFFSCSGDHRDLHSFPTRRSSDLSSALLSLANIQLVFDASFHPGGLSGELIARALASGLNKVGATDRKSTRLNSSHMSISYAVFCLKKKKNKKRQILYRHE